MSIENRIAALEARQRERDEADAPPQLQHADRAPDGSVIACERLTWPTIREQREQNMGLGAMRFVRRELFSLSTCPYTGCEHRDTCRADGRATSWGAS